MPSSTSLSNRGHCICLEHYVITFPNYVIPVMAATCGVRYKSITDPMGFTVKQYEEYHYICEFYILTRPNEVPGLYLLQCLKRIKLTTSTDQLQVSRGSVL
jgi:hypothetical protein